eukprot:351965-Chlamydomonas_euryale.AAC.27
MEVCAGVRRVQDQTLNLGAATGAVALLKRHMCAVGVGARVRLTWTHVCCTLCQIRLLESNQDKSLVHCTCFNDLHSRSPCRCCTLSRVDACLLNMCFGYSKLFSSIHTRVRYTGGRDTAVTTVDSIEKGSTAFSTGPLASALGPGRTALRLHCSSACLVYIDLVMRCFARRCRELHVQGFKVLAATRGASSLIASCLTSSARTGLLIEPHTAPQVLTHDVLKLPGRHNMECVPTFKYVGSTMQRDCSQHSAIVGSPKPAQRAAMKTKTLLYNVYTFPASTYSAPESWALAPTAWSTFENVHNTFLSTAEG